MRIQWSYLGALGFLSSYLHGERDLESGVTHSGSDKKCERTPALRLARAP